jgi:hypothetical protein
MGEVRKHNNLRNAIAHNVWSRGKRPNSIKPISLGVRGGTTSIKGVSEEEPDYTPEELGTIVDDLFKLHEQFRRYLLEIGYLPMRTS